MLDWPSLVRWMKTQLPLRKIIGYSNYQEKFCGWKDKWSSEGCDITQSTAFDDAVLSSEIVGLLESAPISLSTKESIEIRDYLIGMGLLVAHPFSSRVKGSI